MDQKRDAIKIDCECLRPCDQDLTNAKKQYIELDRKAIEIELKIRLKCY